MSVQENERDTITGLACAACVANLAESELQLLPETDAEVVSEHLSQCPHCRLFNEQLDTTREILASMRAAGLTADSSAVSTEAQSDPVDFRSELSLERLYRVAAALDVEDADELVQQTLLDTLSDSSRSRLVLGVKAARA